jgi:uncharacterized protein (DUF2345 family)
MANQYSAEGSVEGATSLELSHNQHLIVHRDTDRSLVQLRGPQGVSLTIEVTAAGPVLRFDGPSLALDARGALSISADSIAICARHGLKLSAGGDAQVTVLGDLEVAANAQTLRARAGDVQVSANDDVKLNGERVLLNC